MKDSDIAKSRSFFLSIGVIGGHEGKGLVPAWHLINCLSIFISLNQSCGRSGVITSWVWKQSHLVLSAVLDLRRGGRKKKKRSSTFEKVWRGGCCVDKIELKNHIHKFTSSYYGLSARGKAQQHLNLAGTIFLFFLVKMKIFFFYCLLTYLGEFVFKEKKTILQLLKALHEVTWIFPFLVIHFLENLQIIYLFIYLVKIEKHIWLFTHLQINTFYMNIWSQWNN